MIKKSLLVAILLFALYTVFVIFFAPTWWNASQHQWQTNIINAQNYMYNESDTNRNVILGSSLSCRLVSDSLPGTYNLALNGQSIFDGLNILIHAKKYPVNVFIETNVVLRSENETFTSSLTTPILSDIKRTLPSLRAGKQPVGIIGKLAFNGIYKIKSLFGSGIEEEVALPPGIQKNNDLFEKMLDFQRSDYSEVPDPDLLKANFNSLKEYIVKLENRGIKIIFFEMPVRALIFSSWVRSL
jgi:hypothetical protein